MVLVLGNVCIVVSMLVGTLTTVSCIVYCLPCGNSLICMKGICNEISLSSSEFKRSSGGKSGNFTLFASDSFGTFSCNKAMVHVLHIYSSPCADM